jgi:hypothetical protein
MLAALKRLSRREANASIHPAFLELFASMGDQKGGFSGFVMKSPFLVRLLLMPELLDMVAFQVVGCHWPSALVKYAFAAGRVTAWFNS